MWPCSAELVISIFSLRYLKGNKVCFHQIFTFLISELFAIKEVKVLISKGLHNEDSLSCKRMVPDEGCTLIILL